MSERILKIIFALVVLVFVVIGKNYSPTIKADNSLNALIVQEYRTASLVAKSALSSGEEVTFAADEFNVLGERTITTSSPSNTSLLLKINKAPRIVAPMFLLGDLAENENIVQLSINKRWPIASITKLMTAVVALEEIPPGTYITISEEASKIEGSAGNFIPGKIFKVEDLIKAMMVVSSNHAAFAIQQFVGKDKFVKLMNSTADRLGMHETYYEEATGLSVLNQSTVQDLKILTYYIWEKHKEIFSYSRIPELKILDKTTGSGIMIRNINIFAGKSDFLGGKTGFINDSGGNLVSIFSRENKQIITIVLGAEDRFLETKILMQWFDDLSN